MFCAFSGNAIEGCGEVTEEKVAEIQTESEKYMVASLYIFVVKD